MDQDTIQALIFGFGFILLVCIMAVYDAIKYWKSESRKYIVLIPSMKAKHIANNWNDAMEWMQCYPPEDDIEIYHYGKLTASKKGYRFDIFEDAQNRKIKPII